MPDAFSVSGLARQLGCKPREISTVIYERLVPDDLCPLVGGRRQIPATAVSAIEAALAKRRAAATARQAIAAPPASPELPASPESVPTPPQPAPHAGRTETAEAL